jgi:hypothetical protein
MHTHKTRPFRPTFALPTPSVEVCYHYLLLTLAHIQGETETPTEGIGSAMVGRNGPVLCICRRGGFNFHTGRMVTPYENSKIENWTHTRAKMDLHKFFLYFLFGPTLIGVCGEGIIVRASFSRFIF